MGGRGEMWVGGGSGRWLGKEREDDRHFRLGKGYRHVTPFAISGFCYPTVTYLLRHCVNTSPPTASMITLAPRPPVASLTLERHKLHFNPVVGSFLSSSSLK